MSRASRETNAATPDWNDRLKALAIARERQLLAWDGGVLAAMAAAHFGLSDFARALALAEEAIAASRRAGTRLHEFSAQLTRIRALRETRGLQATREIEAAIADADAWLEMSGARRVTRSSCTSSAPSWPD